MTICQRKNIYNGYKISALIKYVLKPTGSFFLNIGNKPTEPLIPFEVALCLGRQFKLQNVIHRIKSIAISKDDISEYPNIHGDITVEHFKPIVSKKFLNNCHEYIFILLILVIPA
jgi:site-specific DNA-methyltransferase (adenine-specific)